MSVLFKTLNLFESEKKLKKSRKNNGTKLANHND